MCLIPGVFNFFDPALKENPSCFVYGFTAIFKSPPVIKVEEEVICFFIRSGSLVLLSFR